MGDQEKFDGVLLGLATQMEGGVPELFDVLFRLISFKYMPSFITMTERCSLNRLIILRVPLQLACKPKILHYFLMFFLLQLPIT